MNEKKDNQKCLACNRDSSVTPLLPVEYRGERIWICPQHLPVLIHNPTELTGKLAGAEDLKPADHHD